MSTPSTDENRTPQPAGLRRRIVTPSPPAPVPTARPKPLIDPEPEDGARLDRSSLTTAPTAGAATATATATATVTTPATPPAAPASDVGGENQATAPGGTDEAKTSDRQVVASTGSMAIATLISRITGFIRNLLIGAMLGGAVASAFTTANTLPNMITEIVLGSVMTSLVVPVLVRAEREDPDRGAAFIRRLFTLTITLMGIVAIIAVLAAPFLTRIQLREDGQVNVELATSFAYLLLPQIFFYGLFSLFMAVLNTKEIFKPGAWAPVLNNVIAIATLLLYGLLPGSINPAAPVNLLDPHVVLLGLGTTLGVVAQCAIMVPALKRAGVNLRPLWGIDARLKQFGGMAVAIIVYVAISQLGLIVTTRVASGADEAAPYIYSQAWLLLQVPYGIIGVTLVTAIMPRLSRNAAAGDDAGVVRDLSLATKLTFIAIIPIIVFMTAFGPDIGVGLFHYGSLDFQEAYVLGLSISFSAFTLIPYALVMLHLRVFYAREEAWTPTFIIAGITATKIVLSYLAPLVATSPTLVVILLAAANGFGFVSGAVIGSLLLRRKLGPLGSRTVLRTSAWALAAGLVGLAAAALARWVLSLALESVLAGLHVSIGTLIELAVAGVVFVIVTGVVLAKSGLPEVQNVGRMLTRIPGLNKVITPDEDKAIDIAAPDARDLSEQLFAQDSFNSSPVPPPMSAGVVRGPRLVPGAPVSDGRFRLIADHGSVPGARFWQAVEAESGKQVALTFVDTSGQAPLAPRTTAEAAKVAAEVARNTRRLGKLDHPAVADNIRILGYRSGCLIVSDWVDGLPLRTVAQSGADPDDPTELNPHAVAYALAPLADVVADAEAAGTPLGLDNSSRLRVSRDGTAVLAFPAVLPEATVHRDASGLASAIQLLASATAEDNGEVDLALAQIAVDARAVADESEEDQTAAREAQEERTGNPKIRDLSSRLHTFGSYTEAGTDAAAETDVVDTPADDRHSLGAAPHLAVASDAADEPKQLRGGFGSRGYSRSGMALVVVTAILFVSLIAAATTFLAGLIGGDSEQSPVSTDSIQGERQNAAPPQLPVLQDIEAVSIWQATGQNPAADNPEDAAYLTDQDTDTRWTSDEYPQGLGTKPGIGLALSTADPVLLDHLLVQSSSAGTRFSVYALPENVAANEVSDLAELPRVAEGELHTGRNNIELAEDVPPAGGVIFWITELPSSNVADSVTVSEIAVVGRTATPDAVTDARDDAEREAEASEEMAEP